MRIDDLDEAASDRDAMLEEVMWRGAIRERAHARAAVEGALAALSGHLAPADARAIAESLPLSLRAVLTRGGDAAPVGPGALYERLTAGTGVSLGLAVEHARAACAVIAAALDREQRLLLSRRLPADWAELFSPPPEAPAADLPRGALPGHGHTLATGKPPGGRHPLAETVLPAGQANSVVTAENPHAEDKLSSARDSTSTARLASGRPGADEPIAEARDERLKS